MMWLVRRILFAVLAWFIAVTIVFILLRVAPGNPAIILLNQCLEQGNTYDYCVTYVNAYVGFAPDEPIITSYVKYMVNLFTGNLGVSIYYRVPVTSIVANAIPWTVFFASISLVFTVLIGIFLGLLMAYYRRTMLETVLRTVLPAMESIPNWVYGFLLFYYIGFQAKLLPYRGAYDRGLTPGFNLPFIVSVLQHYTLPILSFVLAYFPVWTFRTMSTAVSVLGEDYVQYAHARGLPKLRILFSYVARNSILPVYTFITITFAHLIVGTTWIENMFQLPGMGYILTNAVGGRDYPVAMGIFLVMITAIIVGNIFTDLTYGLIDPRARIREA